MTLDELEATIRRELTALGFTRTEPMNRAVDRVLNAAVAYAVRHAIQLADEARIREPPPVTEQRRTVLEQAISRKGKP